MEYLFLFLLYIIVGSIITVLATYVNDAVLDSDAYPLFVLLWPFYTLPLLLTCLIKKAIDYIREWL